jgi:hypothetical protein
MGWFGTIIIVVLLFVFLGTSVSEDFCKDNFPNGERIWIEKDSSFVCNYLDLNLEERVNSKEFNIDNNKIITISKKVD